MEGDGAAEQRVDLDILYFGQVIHIQMELGHPTDFIDCYDVILIDQVVFEDIGVLATQLDQHGSPSITELDPASLLAEVLQVERSRKLLSLEPKDVSLHNVILNYIGFTKGIK